MKFELSEKLNTGKSKEEVYLVLKDQFYKASNSVKMKEGKLIVKSIEATFGSINRTDKTNIILKEKNGGFICIAEVTYRPSFMFWVLVLLLISTGVFWLMPIGFYLYQKKTVSEAITNVFKRVKDEVEEFKNEVEVKNNSIDSVSELERLATLKEKGIISEEEFKVQKTKILNIN